MLRAPSRFALPFAMFIGPVLATTVLALAPPRVLYLVLAGLGPAAVPVAMWRRPASPGASG
jgi:hypothetical protein